MKKRNLFIVMAVYFWMFLVPFGAFGSGDTTENWLVQILLAILAFAGSVAVAVLPVVGLYLIKRYRLDLKHAEFLLVSGLGVKAIEFGEEQASKAIKDELGKMDSNKKMNEAVGFFIDGAKKLGLPKMGEDWIKKQIEASLGKLHIADKTRRHPGAKEV